MARMKEIPSFGIQARSKISSHGPSRAKLEGTEVADPQRQNQRELDQDHRQREPAAERGAAASGEPGERRHRRVG